jgi:hypothetical protein
MAKAAKTHDPMPETPAEEEHTVAERETVEDAGPAFGWFTLWFGVVGGVAAWSLHVLVAWSFLEVGCLGPASPTILQQGSGPGTVASVVAYVATGLPWLVALLALLTCIRMRLRMRRAHAEASPRLERTDLMIIIGLFLDVMSLLAVTGSAVGIIVLEPCRWG